MSQVFTDWCEENEVLDGYVLISPSQLRNITWQWIKEYSQEGRHSSVGQIPPAMFRRQIENGEISDFELSH